MNNILRLVSVILSILMIFTPITAPVDTNENNIYVPTEVIKTTEPTETHEEPAPTEPELTEPEITEPEEIPDEVEPEEPTPTEPTEPARQYYDVPLSKDLQDYIFDVCESCNIDPELVIAMIYRESSFKASTIGDGGESFGLLQIQPKWHQARMDKLGCTNLLDPYQNVKVGVDYLTELFAYGKSVEWTLMAYNGGPTYANRKAANGIISNYAKQVLQYASELKFA